MAQKSVLTAVFLFAYALPAFAASGVLQSAEAEGKTTPSEGSTLVPAGVAPAAPAASSPAPASSPQSTIRMKLTPKPKPVEERKASPGGTPLYPSSGVASPFQTVNPHKATPEGTSPFIYKVGAEAEGYRKMPAVNYGKVKVGSMQVSGSGSGRAYGSSSMSSASGGSSS